MPAHYGKFVSYYRVSTDRQGRSGLGLDAQKEAVQQRLNGGRWQLVAEFVEIESGKRARRPQLDAAFAACKKHKAKPALVLRADSGRTVTSALGEGHRRGARTGEATHDRGRGNARFDYDQSEVSARSEGLRCERLARSRSRQATAIPHQRCHQLP